MRILFTCRPGSGHILPLLPLAKAATAAGHAVTFATAAEVHPIIAANGLDAVTAGHGPDPAIRATLSGPSAPVLEQQRMVAFTRFFAGSEMEPRLRDLERIVAQFRPDVIVHEVSEVAAPLAAAAARIPLVTLGFGPLLDLNVLEAVAKVVAPLWRSRGLEPDAWAGYYRDLYIDPCPPALQVSDIAKIPKVQLMRTQDGKALPPPGWLTVEMTPMAYVTFGTIFNKNLEVFRRSIEALKSLNLHVCVTVGDGVNAADLGQQPPSVHVAQYIPQHAILGNCKLVVSHGGAGTTLGALAFGVPLLLLPQGADQHFNAQCCVAAGVALTLRPEEATVEAIAHSASCLLSDKAFAERAKHVAGQIAAMPSPSEAIERINGLVV